MRRDQFSRQIRLGFEEVQAAYGSVLWSSAVDEPALAGLTFNDVAGLARDAQVPLSDQDLMWAAVLRCYQRGPAPVWGPVVLEMLAAELVDLATRFSALTPAADPGDIQQQLVLETLQAAKRIKALPGRRFIKLRLSREIKRKVRRRLGRRAKFALESFEALTVEDPTSIPTIDDEGVWELADVRASNVRLEDLALVSLELRGDKLEVIAREMGCTPNALDCRLRRARARLQRQLAA